MLFDSAISSTTYAEMRARYSGQDNCQSAVRFYNPNNGYGGAVTFWTQPEVNNASMVERMRIDSSGKVGVGTTSSLSGLNVVKSQVYQDTQLSYNKVNTFFAASNFDNPVIPLITISSGVSSNNYMMYNIKVTVFQNSWASQLSVVQRGYACLSFYSSTTAIYTPYVSSMVYEGGTNGSATGTLSWSNTTGVPSTLNYNTSRLTNFDTYTVVLEVATSGINQGLTQSMYSFGTLV
jgi:hypothetical protein